MYDFNREKFEKIKEHWKDKYKLELAINKHVRELANKLDYIDAVDLSTYYKDEKERLKHAYQKEMADLMILFMLFFEQSNQDYDDLLNIRLDKFEEMLERK